MAERTQAYTDFYRRTAANPKPRPTQSPASGRGDSIRGVPAPVNGGGGGGRGSYPIPERDEDVKMAKKLALKRRLAKTAKERTTPLAKSPKERTAVGAKSRSKFKDNPYR